MTPEKIIETARAELGVTEYPPKTNNVKYNTEYWGYECYSDEYYPWCMVFVWWVFKHAGAEELIAKTASCPTLARWAQNGGTWVTGKYVKGDVVLFRFGSSGYDHVGIVETVNGDGTYTTIEGNTSLTSDDNGGAVMRRYRYDYQIVGAHRPKYEEEDSIDMTREEVIKTVNDAVAEVIGTKAEFQEYLAEIIKDAIPQEEIYNTLDEVPDYWRDDIRVLIEQDIIRGESETELGLTRSQCKNAVIAKRIADNYHAD